MKYIVIGALVGFILWMGPGGGAVGRSVTIDRVKEDAFGAAPPVGLKLPAGPVFRTEALTGPMPTNRWWSSAAWTPFSDPLYAHPLVYKATELGLGMGYPPMKVRGGTNPTFTAMYENDLTLGLDDRRFHQALVSDFSDWTVDLQFQSRGATLTTRIGHGFPYVYAEFTGASPLVMTGAPYELWPYDVRKETNDGAEGEGTVKGEGGVPSSVVGMTVKGRHYGLFCPAGAQWVAESDTVLRCEGLSEGYLSIALLPDERPETLAYFARHAFVFPVNTTTTWAYNRHESTVETTYSVTSQVKEGDVAVPLMALYPHQWLYADEHRVRFTPHTYVSPRGPMKLVASNRVVTVHTYPGMLPYMPPVKDDDRNRLQSLFREAIVQPFWPPGLGTGENDTYWEGKNFNRVSQLVPIAKQLGAEGAVGLLINELKARFAYWLHPTYGGDRHGFYYDGENHALFGYPTSHGADEHVNDHHFHYGYFIHAAGHVALEDRGWAMDENKGGRLRQLIADWATDRRDDPKFPFLRTFDPYAGHSWASGTGMYPEGNNQESSSEAIHAWAGLILFGEATGDDALRDLGVWGYTLESVAASLYWFNETGDLFPSDFKPPVIGRLYGAGGDYNTWWTRDADAVHGINLLPITGASLHLGHDTDRVLANYAYYVEQMKAAGKDPERTGWNDILQSYRALADPEAAFAAWQAFPAVEFGETSAHTYHWIQSLSTYGTIVTGVTADTPFYAVFERDGLRTYVVYNAGNKSQKVTFSDGLQLEADARSMALRQYTPRP